MAHESVTDRYKLGELREKLFKHFSEGELRTLCTDLSIDYDALPGGGKEDKVRELVAYFDRRVRIRDLRDKCAQERPNVKWPEYPMSESVSQGAQEPVRREREFPDRRQWQRRGIWFFAEGDRRHRLLGDF